MARTDLTISTAPDPYDTDGAALTWEAGDPSNGNQFDASGRDVLLVRNTDAVNPQTVTVISTPDRYGRTGDASRSVPANGSAVFQKFPLSGWVQDDGNIYVDVADAAIELAVVRIP